MNIYIYLYGIYKKTSSISSYIVLSLSTPPLGMSDCIFIFSLTRSCTNIQMYIHNSKMSTTPKICINRRRSNFFWFKSMESKSLELNFLSFELWSSVGKYSIGVYLKPVEKNLPFVVFSAKTVAFSVTKRYWCRKSHWIKNTDHFWLIYERNFINTVYKKIIWFFEI